MGMVKPNQQKLFTNYVYGNLALGNFKINAGLKQGFGKRAQQPGVSRPPSPVSCNRRLRRYGGEIWQPGFSHGENFGIPLSTNENRYKLVRGLTEWHTGLREQVFKL